MNGKHFDVKDMEREYKRGRVEELQELHNKMCFKHFDSKSMNPERYSAVKEYVEKRLLKLQGVEK